MMCILRWGVSRQFLEHEAEAAWYPAIPGSIKSYAVLAGSPSPGRIPDYFIWFGPADRITGNQLTVQEVGLNVRG